MPNFGILQPIQAPQMMGALPSSPAQPGAGDALGGLLQGIQQGMAQKQQSEMNALNMKAKQQEMTQSAQLFPEQLEKAKTDNQVSKIDLQDKKQRLEYANKLNDFANKTEEQYLQSLRPEDRYRILEQKSKLNYAMAEAQKAGVDAAYSMATYIATANSSASQYSDPKEQQLAYSKVRVLVPPDVQKYMEAQYDPSFAPIAIANGAKAEAQNLRNQGKSAPDNRTSEQKNLHRANELTQKVKNKTATQEDIQELTGLQSTQANQLRDEFVNQTKPFKEVSDAYGRINASGKDPSAAGDLSLIFNYMKMLDPGSTVREGEFATAQNSGSVPTQIQAMYNKVTRGERLTLEQRKDFVSRAGKLYGSQKEGYTKLKEDYTKKADRAGINPEDIIVDYSINSREQESTNSFQEGKIYQDANGNKARYINGKWEVL